MKSMVRFENVTKKYGKHKALDNVSFDIKEGEFLSVVGQSGAGKSTVVKMIVGEDRPDDGKVVVDDLVVNKLKKREMPYFRRKIGVVFQNFRLLPNKTAYENVAFAMEVSGVPTIKIKKDVPRILDIVGLSEKQNSLSSEMSGGEQQRVAIARSLANNPRLLVADEPTGNLDSLNAWEIIQLLMKINQYGTTIILATHAKELVNNIKKRVLTIDKGELIFDQEKGKYVL